MSSMYDFILNRKFGGAIFKILFPAGLALRDCYFSLHNLCGLVLYRRRRSFAIDTNKLKRFVCIRTDRIGDIILTTPVFKALRTKFGEGITIDIVVQEKYEDLMNCYPGWDSVITVQERNDRREINKTGRSLAENKYDAAIVFHPASYAYRLAAASQAPVAIGWNAKGFGYLLSHAVRDDRDRAHRHQTENNLKLLEPLGIHESAPVFTFTETEKGKAEADTFLSNHQIESSAKIIVIHPGSYSPRVRWHASRFAELNDRIINAGYTSVVIGSGSDSGAVGEMVKFARCKPVNALNIFSLEGTVSLLKRAFIFVGNSTGPMHIAASVGTWTIAIFGNQYVRDREELWRPFSDKGIVISSPYKCKKCIPWTCPDMPCLSAITVDMVWEQIQNKL
jgi:ADP-heptose:LPS heptosyltransferase